MFATLLAALVNELAPERLRALVIAALTNTPPTTPTLPAPAPAELKATPALIEPAEPPRRRRRRRAGERPQKRIVARAKRSRSAKPAPAEAAAPESPEPPKKSRRHPKSGWKHLARPAARNGRDADDDDSWKASARAIHGVANRAVATD